VLTTIAVTPVTPSIFTGGTQQLTAVGYDQGGNPMTGVVFAWSSANKSVASVDITGLASGVSAGTSQMSASAEGVNSNAVTLTVNRSPSVLTSITASPSSASIQAGDVQQFVAVGYDQYGNAMSGIVFAWYHPRAAEPQWEARDVPEEQAERAALAAAAAGLGY
jgi:hypothetical protein